jgi:hypothetical protein
MNCRQLEPLLTSFVDGEADAVTARQVEAHLAACAACRGHAAQERLLRDLLRARADQLREVAPAGLRNVVLLGAGTPATRASGARTRVSAFAAAAALVFMVVATVQFVPLRPAALHAAQIALDHFQCWYFWEHVEQGDGAASAERDVHQQTGWIVRIPPSDVEGGLLLVRARRCPYFYGPHAHSFYRLDDREVSLYITVGEQRGAGHVRILGHDQRMWSANGRTYAVVARGLTGAELDHVEAYFRRTAH